ncbi:5'-nucleotidase domain-containing protein 3, partial [Contarinia nasturtii]|uniref:5'-nucleotidase domain-containing protein 3 n=1 Tax=Contarinia nasturtii TaxID=265458 RepID=UPI0012D3C65D
MFAKNRCSLFMRLLTYPPKVTFAAERSIHNYDEIYEQTKTLFQSKKLPKNVNKTAVFACNELDLNEIQVYGFDYDYTLACYKKSLHYLLYGLARDMLVEKYKYPEAIKSLEYMPGFAIRGLHYDIEKGLLLKLDSFLQIQFGSVYRGLTPITDAEVVKHYRNRSIPLAYVEGSSKTQYGRGKMIQLADLFSVPEISLLCNVAEYFQKEQLNYHPEILFSDVKHSMGACHPIMHRIVAQDVNKYIEANPQLKHFFKRLKDDNKQLFLVTNSPYHFVNQGMNMLVGQNWKDYFDIVIVQARKPRFFTDETRPFRVFDTRAGTHLWDRVCQLEKGRTYFEGTVKQLQEMMNWSGHEVLYFGDHPYSDLADVTLEHSWRTGA